MTGINQRIDQMLDTLRVEEEEHLEELAKITEKINLLEGLQEPRAACDTGEDSIDLEVGKTKGTVTFQNPDGRKPEPRRTRHQKPAPAQDRVLAILKQYPLPLAAAGIVDEIMKTSDVPVGGRKAILKRVSVNLLSMEKAGRVKVHRNSGKPYTYSIPGTVEE